MRKSKLARLQTKGWKFGSAGDFLELSPEERAYVELKLSLSDGIRELRNQTGITQTELAERLSSSQSRVAKIERGDPSVSVDLMVRSLLALGMSRRELGRLIAASAA